MSIGEGVRPIVFAIAAVALAVLLTMLSPLRRLELWADDARQRLVTGDRSFSDAVLVAIDDDSITRLRGAIGDWPYRRDVYARVVDFLSAAGARAVVFDILFADPRPGDDAFAAVLARSVPVALAAVATPYALEADPQDRSVATRRGWRAGPELPAPVWADVRLPQPGLAARASVGVVTVAPDEDGVVRRLALLHRIGGGAVLPTLALAGRFPQSPGPATAVPRPGHVRIGDETWPVDDQGRITLAFGRRPYETPRVPFAQVVEAALRGAPTAADATLGAMIHDRTVYVGSTALLLEDATPTPLGRVPGVVLAMQAHLALTHHLVLAPASWRWDLLVACLAIAVVVTARLASVDSLPWLFAAGATGLTLSWAASLSLLAVLQQPTAILMPVVATATLLALLVAERVAVLRATRVHLTHERLAVERTAQLKSEFLAHVSHELRTPLTAILGFSRVLADETELPADKRALVQIIRRNGEQLLWLVNNLLDQARIAASQMSIDPQPSAVRDSVDYVSALLAGVPRRVGVELHTTCADDVPPRLLVDAQRLQQILINLAANGLKFTERGEVRVAVTWQGGWLEASVSDTGPGISPLALHAIFEAFNQGDAAVARRGGTGLGLTISRNLARLMGGELTVTSTVGVGSTFQLRLPAPAVARDEPATEVSPTAGRAFVSPAIERAGGSARPRPRALVADDSEDIRAFLEIYLHRLGLDVFAAANGREAVDLGLAHCPDVILLDVQMPTMDGVEAMRLLRRAGFSGRLVALTAGSGEQLQSDLMAAGFDIVLFKPVTGNELTDALARLLELPSVPASSATPTAN